MNNNNIKCLCGIELNNSYCLAYNHICRCKYDLICKSLNHHICICNNNNIYYIDCKSLIHECTCKFKEFQNCKSNDHICYCEINPSYGLYIDKIKIIKCNQIIHDCLCNNLVKTRNEKYINRKFNKIKLIELCLSYNHKCICNFKLGDSKMFKVCKSIKHQCICDTGKFMDCKSFYHICICNNNNYKKYCKFIHKIEIYKITECND